MVNNHVVVRIDDDGVGFDEDLVTGGQGLRNLRASVVLLDAARRADLLVVGRDGPHFDRDVPMGGVARACAYYATGFA